MRTKQLHDDIKKDLSNIEHDTDMTLHQVLKIFNEVGEMREVMSILYKNQEKGLVKDKDLVIIYDKGKTRIYEHGEDITTGITEITFRPDSLPVIEYEKVVK